MEGIAPATNRVTSHPSGSTNATTSGPMPSGVANKDKQRVRQLYAEGKAGKDELLEAESKSYHSPGTCTFYGTANSNQMMMELMGLHIPNAAFINPGTPLRQALTRAAVHRLAQLANSGERPLGFSGRRFFDHRINLV